MWLLGVYLYIIIYLFKVFLQTECCNVAMLQHSVGVRVGRNKQTSTRDNPMIFLIIQSKDFFNVSTTFLSSLNKKNWFSSAKSLQIHNSAACQPRLLTDRRSVNTRLIFQLNKYNRVSQCESVRRGRVACACLFVCLLRPTRTWRARDVRASPRFNYWRPSKYRIGLTRYCRAR